MRMRGKKWKVDRPDVDWVKKKTTQSTSGLSTKHKNFIWEHHTWCHVNISEVATLVSMIPIFLCRLKIAAAELHLSFVIKCKLWWKRTFLPMATIVVLHQGLQPTARGPNAAREAISSGQRSHFFNDEKNNVEKNCEMYLRKICWFGRILYNISRNNHTTYNVRHSIYFYSLYGPRSKTFGDPCVTSS